MKAKEELKELRLKSTGELQRLLKLNREKLRDIRFKISQSQVKNIREIREIKKRTARIISLLNAKKEEKSEKNVVKEKQDIIKKKK